MAKYTEFSLDRDEIAVIREILNDSGVHFSHMGDTHASAEHRVADRLGMDERDVSRLATQVWRMLDRSES